MPSKKKSKVWACGFNCTTKNACRHLQALLPPVDTGYMSKAHLEDIEQTWYGQTRTMEDVETEEKQAEALKEIFRQVGLSDEQADLLINRFVYKMSLAALAVELQFVDASAVAYFLNHTLNNLKIVGSKQLQKLLKERLMNEKG